ncbi:MAG: hypothetical protein IJW33_00240 [Lentisphaeria bacterium]|nr:hypothetical protein [Lentisphaeria bacterium]
MNKNIWLKQYRSITVPVLLFLLGLIFSAAFLPENPVWITDNGNKEMIARNFLEHGTIFFSHELPENFPRGGFHFLTLPDGKISSFHSPYLPVLTAYLYPVAGDFCWNLLPLLALAALAAVMMKFPGKKRYLLAAALGTPLLFYGLQFWEMVPAAFMVTLSAWLFCRKKVEASGLVFGLGVWMREELYLLGAGVLIALIIERKWREIWRFGLGAALPVLALWVTNYLLFGNIAGMHGAEYFVNNRESGTPVFSLKETVFNFYQHIIRFETAGRWSMALAIAALIPSFAAGMMPEYRSKKNFKTAAGVIFALISALLAVMLWQKKEYLLVSAGTFGLFLSIPILGLFLLNLRPLLTDKRQLVRLGTGVVIFYILTIPFLLNPHDIGLTWGARHFIMVIPVMMVLTVYAFHRQGGFSDNRKWLFRVLCAVGVFMQIYALTALVKVTESTSIFQEEILAQKAPVVISDLFFIPEMIPQTASAKLHLEVTGQKQLDSVLAYLEEKKIREAVLILSPDYRQISNETLRRLLRHYPPAMKPVEHKLGNSIRVMYTILRKPRS